MNALPESPTYPRRCALVGCGRIAARHLAALRAMPDHYMLIGAVDPDTSRHELLDVPCFTSLEMLLAQHSPELVIICSPSGAHADQVELALRADAHVLCEKPVAMHAARVRALDDLASDRGLLLVPCHQTRLLEVFTVLERVLDTDALGPLHTVNGALHWCRPQRYFDEESWRGSMLHDGGVLLNQASHLLDWMMRAVTHAGICEVFAWAKTLRREIQAPDHVTMCWRGARAQGTFTASVLAEPVNFGASLTLLGDLGAIELSGPRGYTITRWDVPGMPLDIERVNDETTRQARLGHLPLYQWLAAWLAGDARDVLARMRQGARDVARCIDVVQRASTTGRPILWHDTSEV